MKKYTVFYNHDCAKYGLKDENGHQVLIKTKQGQKREDSKCYTKYKGVASRWCKNMNNGKYEEWTY